VYVLKGVQVVECRVLGRDLGVNERDGARWRRNLDGVRELTLLERVQATAFW
jgi:hypothetical protein